MATNSEVTDNVFEDPEVVRDERIGDEIAGDVSDEEGEVANSLSSHSLEGDSYNQYSRLIAKAREREIKVKEREKKKEEDEKIERVSRRLTYLLRYGAVQEGLVVQSGGYVELQSMLKVPLMKYTTEVEVLDLLSQSLSYRGTPRFETKEERGVMYVRARYGLNMERSPFHQGTKVMKLVDTCLGKICEKITDYDFEGFPDSFLFNAILHKMKRDRKLSNNTLRTILNPSTDHLDLEGVYLTPTTLKIISERCPDLKVLSLRGAGYVLNDQYMEQLFKKVQNLRSLNISGCHHLTDRTLNSLAKTNHELIHFNASGNRLYTEQALLNLVLACPKLQHLDIYDNPNITDGGRGTLIEISRQRKLTVVLRNLNDESVAPEDPAMVLNVWRGAMV